MAILPSDEASLILRHYVRTLVERSGLRWTAANDADFDRLADRLDQAAPELDEMPPYTPPIVSDRQTVVLDRPQDADPNFRRWQAQRADDERVEQARRMMRR
jgi:hypothetical protein